jgi:hypothetical protein
MPPRGQIPNAVAAILVYPWALILGMMARIA